MFHLPYVEFCITNVCNLNCPDCNKFNNYHFSGHELWHEHADEYEQWASKITFDEIAIIGGEPTLNPDFIKWVNNVARLWPTSRIVIQTNGTQLDRWDELYNIMSASNGRILIYISIHGYTLREKTYADINNWMQGPITKTFVNGKLEDVWQQQWQCIRGETWPESITADKFDTLLDSIKQECIEDYQFSPFQWENDIEKIDAQIIMLWTDSNGVRIGTVLENSFTESAVTYQDSRLSLHDSDPEHAMNACFMWRLHQFVDGKIYKCGPAALLPKFTSQFPVDITDSDRKLINSYNPASVNDSDSNLGKFINGLNNRDVIPQCKFCPSNSSRTTYEAGTKKIKIHKL